jgi:dTMP kinase
MARGRFISFEGPEGGGKTTQAARLIARLRSRDLTVLDVREPGGTPTGEAIREILQHDRAGEPICPETEALLFAASRAQLVRRRILPALEQGAWVVCDRFADSTTAYQGFGRGFPVEDMIRINDFAIDGANPDVTILLDVDGTTGRTRLAARHAHTGKGPDRIEREEASFHARVRDGYLTLAQRFPQRFRIINAARDVEAVAAEVWEAVEPLTEPAPP